MGIFGDVFGEDGSFAATGCADEGEVTMSVFVQKFVYSAKDKLTTDKVFALFSNELLKLWRMSSWIGCGWGFRC